MKTARSQFITAVGLAVDIAAEEGVAPIEMISSLGSYVDIVIRCTGGDKAETSKMLSALSAKYNSESTLEQLAGEPIYTPVFAANA